MPFEITLCLDNSFSDALEKMAVDGTSETTEELFDCVICGQTSTSTEGRPIGLVALLQPSAGKVAYCLCNQVTEYKMLRGCRGHIFLNFVR